MRAPYTQLYLHLVWSTWDRLPLITVDIEPRIYGAIAKKCRELKCEPISIGGISDHVHLLLRFTTTITIANLVKEIKGSSSHLISNEITPNEFFKWQGAYGAFTIRKSEVPIVKRYIERQKEHPKENTTLPDYENTFVTK